MRKLQYNEIAGAYRLADKCIHMKYIAKPNISMLARNVKGKSVLDLACGNGKSTRLIKQAGAGRVVGIDISNWQIKLAKHREEKNPLGIEYLVADAAGSDFSDIGPFDVVTAAFLLNYAGTKGEIQRMCRNIFNCLKPGGEFLALLENPDIPFQKDKKYEFTITGREPLQEGDKKKLTCYYQGREICSFHVYHWSRETLENALSGTGFRDIKWYRIIVSKEGIERFGYNFWKKYIKNPAGARLKCSRPE